MKEMRSTIFNQPLPQAQADQAQGDWNIVYATPISPGRSRIFVRVVFEVARIPMPLQHIFQVAFSPHFPPVFTHLSNHKVLEDDNIFLHHQGQTMSPGGKQDIGIGRCCDVDKAVAVDDSHFVQMWKLQSRHRFCRILHVE